MKLRYENWPTPVIIELESFFGSANLNLICIKMAYLKKTFTTSEGCGASEEKS